MGLASSMNILKERQFGSGLMTDTEFTIKLMSLWKAPSILRPCTELQILSFYILLKNSYLSFASQSTCTCIC